MSPAMISRPQQTSNTNLLPRGVRRALDAMRANVGRDWTVVDLAGAAGVSSRTLQRQFKMFLGETPHAALRDIRFDCARRELLQSLPEEKVMALALRCGFAHCGRVSIEYRRRYRLGAGGRRSRAAAESGALPPDRRHAGMELANPPDPSADRGRHRPPPV